MSNVSDIKSARKARAYQASIWITKIDRGLSADEEQELRAWLSFSRDNYQEFMESAKLWDRMDGLTRLSEIFPEPVWEESPPLVSSGWKIAASLLIAVGLAVIWSSFDASVLNDEPEMVLNATGHYQTLVGEQSVFDLPDGTRIVLNTNSEVSLDFTESNRLLTLLRGEIHVSVAHDPSRPLSVVVGDRVVQAVGTEFNVEITSDQNIELVVTEGVVLVGVLDPPTDTNALNESVLLQSSSTLVAAGQEVYILASEVEFESIETRAIEAEEIAVKLSWREGNLIFRGESLEEAVSELARYTAVEFVFLDEESKKVRLAGLFRAGDVDGLLNALRENFNISYEWDGGDKILLGGEQ